MEFVLLYLDTFVSSCRQIILIGIVILYLDRYKVVSAECKEISASCWGDTMGLTFYPRGKDDAPSPFIPRTPHLSASYGEPPDSLVQFFGLDTRLILPLYNLFLASFWPYPLSALLPWEIRNFPEFGFGSVPPMRTQIETLTIFLTFETKLQGCTARPELFPLRASTDDVKRRGNYVLTSKRRPCWIRHDGFLDFSENSENHQNWSERNKTLKRTLICF